MHGTYILVSQFSAVQGENTALCPKKKEKIQLKKLHHTSYKKMLQFIQKQIANKQFDVLAGWRFKKKLSLPNAKQF